VNKKYINYSAEDFAQDIHFINWLNKGVNQKEWKNFVSENPHLSEDIESAKKIISNLRYIISIKT
jgi:DNA-binding transcriptional MerR regulator